MQMDVLPNSPNWTNSVQYADEDPCRSERIWRLERYSKNAVEIVSFWMMGIVEGIE